MEKKAQQGLGQQSVIEPNIFSFATSELSQDAMFAWLIKWADVKYKPTDAAIHEIAQSFVRMLVGNG